MNKNDKTKGFLICFNVLRIFIDLCSFYVFFNGFGFGANFTKEASIAFGVIIILDSLESQAYKRIVKILP